MLRVASPVNRTTGSVSPDKFGGYKSFALANHADRIKQPLFVVQGLNDPRVPYTEAEQIVATLQKNGTPVWFLMAKDEGHGFAKKSNADFLFYASVEFVRVTLLK